MIVTYRKNNTQFEHYVIKFEHYVLAKSIDIKEPFPGVESERIALVEWSNGHGQLIKENVDIVRHVNLEHIVKGNGRCQHCSALRHNLFAISVSLDPDRQKQTQESSATNLRYLKIMN